MRYDDDDETNTEINNKIEGNIDAKIIQKEQIVKNIDNEVNDN